MSATPNDIGMQSQKEPEQLEREIEQQRRHIEGIVQALENKLSPGEMFERMLGFGRGPGREFAGNLGTTLKENPLPAVVTAAGLLWLYASSRAPSSSTSAFDGATTTGTGTTQVHATRGVSDRLHSATSAVGAKAHGAVDSIRGGAHGAVDAIRSGARSAGGSVRGGVQRAGDGYGAMLRDNPFAAGAIAVAVGAAIGALIPSTRKEDELLGEASDRMVGQLKSKAREQKDTLVGKAREMARSGGASQGQGGSGADAASSSGAQSSSASLDAGSGDASSSFAQPGMGTGLADDGASSGARPH